MTQPTPRDPHEGIHTDANPEAEAAARDQSPYVARSGSSSGIVDTGPQPGDEQVPATERSGTASGDPLAGVTADEQDVRDAVSGDTGPEHPGQR